MDPSLEAESAKAAPSSLSSTSPSSPLKENAPAGLDATGDENAEESDSDEVFLDVPQANRDRLLIPPLNFSMVQSGVYRSGYPNSRNFGFLIRQLGIHTIICLSAEEPEDLKIGHENSEFIKKNGIKLLRIPIEGQKEPFAISSVEDIRRALKATLDVRNHPVLLHCDKGKHRTGTVIGCLRKIQGWALSSVFDEYSRFCKESTRIMDHQLIEFFEIKFSEEEHKHLPVWMDHV